MEDLRTAPGASLLVTIEAIQNVRGIIAGFFREAEKARERASESEQKSAYNGLAVALSCEAQGGAMRNVLHYLFSKEWVDSLPEVEPMDPWGPACHTCDSIRRMSQEFTRPDYGRL